MNRAFLEATHLPQFRQQARQKYGDFKELGTTWEDNVLLYWFNVGKDTRVLKWKVRSNINLQEI